MKQIFVKLFEYKDKQIVILKTYHPEDQVASFGVSFETLINDVRIAGELGFETIEERDSYFNEIDNEMANDLIAALCF